MRKRVQGMAKPSGPAQQQLDKDQKAEEAFLAAEKAAMKWKDKAASEFKAPTTTPQAGQKGVVGGVVGHRRTVSNPKYLMDAVRAALPVARDGDGQNIRLCDAYKAMEKMKQECLGQCEGLEKLLKDLKIECVLEHGGKSLSEDIMIRLHIGAFAPESCCKGFWRHNLDALNAAVGGSKGCFQIDLEPYLHDSNAGKGARSPGDGIDDFDKFVRLYQVSRHSSSASLIAARAANRRAPAARSPSAPPPPSPRRRSSSQWF